MTNDRARFIMRARIAAVGLVLALIGIGVRVGTLQIGRYEELSRLARDEYLKDLRVPARRGHIYDKNGKPLAISVDVPSVYANPSVIQDPREAARSLAKIMDLDLDTVYRRLASDKLFVWIARQVTPDVSEKVAALEIEGVAITKESRRFYPNRELGAHVIGFTGVDAKGLAGIEREFDHVLAGEPQVVVAVRDARGRVVLAADVDPERRSTGSDVHLTLDLRLQHAAQRALETIVEDTHAAAAVAVVLDVPTGGVLAMAVEPAFNPNEPSQVSAAVRRNRVVTDMFEPGSTMKPLVVAGALEAGTIQAGSKIFCENGKYPVGNHTIRDAKPNGWLSLNQIIAKSSNIGAAKVGQSLGPTRLAATLRSVGFGKRTGITFPGETAGSMRDPATWSQVGNATISFGYGIAVSAVQLAVAYRVLASGGRYDPPVLVRAVETPDGKVETLRAGDGHQVFSAETTARVTTMMETAVASGGTAWRAAVPGYRVAGKTGTAYKVDTVTGGYSADRFVAVFGGFLPAAEPRVVIVVVVDEPTTVHSGSAVAAPVFSVIGEAAMRYLGIVPTEPLSATASAPFAPLEETAVAVTVGAEADVGPDRVPSFLGLTARQVLARYAEVGRGLNLEMRGSGLVVEQMPVPGTQRGRGGLVTLVMASER